MRLPLVWTHSWQKILYRHLRVWQVKGKPYFVPSTNLHRKCMPCLISKLFYPVSSFIYFKFSVKQRQGSRSYRYNKENLYCIALLSYRGFRWLLILVWTGTVSKCLERSLYDRKVVGSILGRVIQNTFKMILAAWLDTQHKENWARTGQREVNIMWLGWIWCHASGCDISVRWHS